MAVTGVPEPQVNHAVIMARFAGDCLSRMNHVVKSLETELGPGTGDLTMRFGIHSGPVTAGVSSKLHRVAFSIDLTIIFFNFCRFYVAIGPDFSW